MTDKNYTNCRNCLKSSATFYSYYECDKCNEPIGAVKTVPIDVLEELAEEMDRGAGMALDSDESAYDAYERCSEKLQDAIENYK